MKISSIKAENIGPIKQFDITNLGNLVIIAGANGSGKTSLKNAMIQSFSESNNPKISFCVMPTRKKENEFFPETGLKIGKGASSAELQRYMATRVARGRWVGAPIHFDDSRVFKQYQLPPLSFNQINPDEEEIGFTSYLNTFENRFESTMQKLYLKAAHRFGEIASTVVVGNKDAKPENFPDPLEPFIKIFSKLLPDKRLKTIDPLNPCVLEYEDEYGESRSVHTLSSGEREVIGISFDLLLINPNHSIIFIDEPELHLHPQLAFRMIQGLLSMGENNQFFLFTHSGDLITSFIDEQVFYIDIHNKDRNQARDLKEITRNRELSRLLGHNIGTFAVGKNVVFVEGEQASLDKSFYDAIAQAIFPDCTIIPMSGQENIMALARICNELLTSAVWGIEIFMIRDRDGLADEKIGALEKESRERLKILSRRHIENYFLNEEILASVLSDDLVEETSPWRDKNFILEQLREIADEIKEQAVYEWAKNYIRMNVGNVSLKVKALQTLSKEKLIEELQSQAQREKDRIGKYLDPNEISLLITSKLDHYEQALSNKKDEVWKVEFPGKIIFAKLVARIPGISPGVIKRKYTKEMLKNIDDKNQDIYEIVEIFKSFWGV